MMLNTSRNPWPFRMYTSLMDAERMLVQTREEYGRGKSRLGNALLNCSVPAVSRLEG